MFHLYKYNFFIFLYLCYLYRVKYRISGWTGQLGRKSLMTKSDAFRQKKEIIDQISSSKLQLDPFSNFSWALSLRNSPTSNPIKVEENKVLTSSLHSTPKIMNYTGEFGSSFSQFRSSFHESWVAQRNFESNAISSSKTMKNQEYYFLEPTSKNPDGIWIRKRPELKLPSDFEIIRKSKYDLSKVTPVKDKDSLLSNFVPKNLIKEIKDSIKSNRWGKFNSAKTSMFNTANSIDFQLTNKSPEIFGVDNEKELTSIEIIGSNKLVAEINSWNNIQGPKCFIKNHYYTETGEGEPDEAEEIIEQSYF